MELRLYTPGDAEAWDALCAEAVNATFLHTRRFLSYHGARFDDVSTLVYHEGQLVGAIPLARDRDDPGLVVSHPGITYGGMLHRGWLTGSRMTEALAGLKALLAGLGAVRLRYKCVPTIYHRSPGQDDLWSLWSLGAKRYRCDLSCAVDLRSPLAFSERRRRSIRKATGRVGVVSDWSAMGQLYPIVAENLKRRYGVEPVHSLAELELLQARFPQEIFLRAALVDGRIEAGYVLFALGCVWHSQYSGTSEAGREMSALDPVTESVLNEATATGVRYFDLGISNEDQGKLLNEGLFRYKAEFGGGGVAHEFYELGLGA